MADLDLQPDDPVDDFQYVWHGPAGAEAWWPKAPMDHAATYTRWLLVGGAVGLTYGLMFGWGLVSRVAPLLVSLTGTYLAVSIYVRGLTPLTPRGYHAAVRRAELRAPRPESTVARTAVTSVPANLATDPQEQM